MAEAQAPLPGLRRLRLAKGLTVRELADATGISKSSLFNAEKPQARSGVQLQTAQRLAEYFGVTVDELLHPQGVCRTVQVAREKAAGLLLSYRAQPVRGCDEQAQSVAPH